jgi:adenylate kinase family enzyme
MKRPQWVVDGNYRRTLDERLALADTVVILAFSTLAGFWYAFVRSIKERGIQRLPDFGMPLFAPSKNAENHDPT